MSGMDTRSMSRLMGLTAPNDTSTRQEYVCPGRVGAVWKSGPDKN